VATQSAVPMSPGSRAIIWYWPNGWKVNRHTTRCTSPVFVVSQCKLMFGWGLLKRRSAPPSGPHCSRRTFYYLGDISVLLRVFSWLLTCSEACRVQSLTPATCRCSWTSWMGHCYCMLTTQPCCDYVSLQSSTLVDISNKSSPPPGNFLTYLLFVDDLPFLVIVKRDCICFNCCSYSISAY